jgi:hypothetical protein
MPNLDLKPVLNALVSHAAGLGYFTRVNTHEPKSAPLRGGFTGAIWAQNLRPHRSGLASTTVRVEWRFRIYTNMLADPQDAIDPALMDAACALIAEYSMNFTLDGLVRSVDLLGEAGNPLGFQAGYLPVDKALFRIIDLTLPVVINDAFTQEA